MSSIFDKINDIVRNTVKRGGGFQLTIEDLLNNLIRELSDFKIANENMEELCKISWNYEEENTRQYSLEQAIRWFKEHMDKTQHSSACLYKEEKCSLTKGVPSTAGSCVSQKTICLHLCFLDKNNEPMLGGDAKHNVVNCLELDDRLARQFGDKNMILLK